jgi:hypothetical protein
VLPTANGVVFDKGLQMLTPNMLAYGTDDDGKVYKIAKQWGQVGMNGNRTVITGKNNFYSSIPTGNPGWQYYTGTGFSSVPSDLGAISGLASAGPLTFAVVRNKVVLGTVIDTSGTYTGQFWLSRSGGDFAPQGTPVALGASGDGSYLGGGLALQPQLQANPAASAMLVAGVASGLPYLLSKRTGSSGSYTLDSAWNLLTMGV